MDDKTEVKDEAEKENEKGDEEQSEEKDEEYYEGEKRDGKKNGRGRLVFKYGVYEGNWENDMMSGVGKLELNTGNVYEGQFKLNKFEGSGKLRWKNGKMYVGEMKNGNMCGRGVMTSEDGEYDGHFFDNDYYGHGRMTFTNGCVYEGEWKLGMMWGEGRLQTGAGVIFEGEFYKNQKHGKVLRTDARNQYSEIYNRDNMETSFKLKKSSKGSVGKFLSKVTNAGKSKEEKSATLFNRPKQTKEEVAKQLDKRAKNNQYHKGESQRSGYSSRAKSPPGALSCPDPKSKEEAKPEAKAKQEPAVTSPQQTNIAPPPLPPCPPPPSDHFVSLQQKS